MRDARTRNEQGVLVRRPAGMRQVRKRGRKDRTILILILLKMVARDSVVGLATRYGLDDPGIESRWRRDLRTRPDRPWGHNQPPIQWVQRPARGGDQPSPYSAEVKERVQLYICSLYGPSRPVLG
jgi:hypothetical protein